MSLLRRHLLAALAALGLLAGCATSEAPDKASRKAPGKIPAPAVAVAAPTPAVAVALPPSANAVARDAFVLLSGGGTPLSNNYSQYLQAKAIATFFERRYADHPKWVFFGVGNREGEPPLLADTHKQVKRDGRVLEAWEPGPLRNNRPATRAGFLTALREEILPTVSAGGTLYLFVGDHGVESRGDNPESVITMWQLKRGTGKGVNWATDNKETLGVAELRRVLAEGIGRGRVVFVMTQCHAGGFHYLGVPQEVAPPSDWFRTLPAWAAPKTFQPPLRAAGFTATDQQSPAAGCDPDPDPDTWAGYERFIPEVLLGLDLFSLEATGPGLRSFAEAHEAATLVDRTIDKPRSSSEQYLERWATTIEKLAGESGLTPRAKAAVAAYRRSVDTGKVVVATPGLRERQAQFQRFTARLVEQAPALRDLLLAGSREKIESAIARPGPRAGPRSAAPVGARPPGGVTDEVRKAWKEVVRPAWKAAVLAGQVPGLAGAALVFEKQLLVLEDQGREFMLARGGQNPMLNELYWRSGYSNPATLDVARAEAVTRWGAERREKIAAWALASTDGAVRKGIATMNLARPRRSATTPAPGPRPPTEAGRPLSPRTAAERVLFYRRTLAAWEFLGAMEHREALAEVQALTDLERTPLP
jgi:hypothetical protein